MQTKENKIFPSLCFRLWLRSVVLLARILVLLINDNIFSTETLLGFVFCFSCKDQLYWRIPGSELNWLEGAWWEVSFTRPAEGTTVTLCCNAFNKDVYLFLMHPLISSKASFKIAAITLHPENCLLTRHFLITVQPIISLLQNTVCTEQTWHLRLEGNKNLFAGHPLAYSCPLTRLK